ncbi:hypothetical protein [Ideonella paludis]|uniref:hypothetical protein n=1 Tax=Ideonella paludis TaxID=1233411 RepID=UPI00363770C6
MPTKTSSSPVMPRRSALCWAVAAPWWLAAATPTLAQQSGAPAAKPPATKVHKYPFGPMKPPRPCPRWR